MRHTNRMQQLSILLVGLLTLVILPLTVFEVQTQQRTQEYAATTTQVSIYDYGFSPGVLTVHVGDIVTWTNTSSSIPHTVTSQGVWDSGNMKPGDSFSYQFQTPGTFSYVCSYHSVMTGTIVVLADEPTATPTPEPSATPTVVDNSPTPTAVPSPTAVPTNNTVGTSLTPTPTSVETVLILTNTPTPPFHPSPTPSQQPIIPAENNSSITPTMEMQMPAAHPEDEPTHSSPMLFADKRVQESAIFGIVSTFIVVIIVYLLYIRPLLKKKAVSMSEDYLVKKISEE